MRWLLGAGMLAAIAAQTGAADRAPLPPAVARLLECRGLVSSDERLACFDREAALLNGSVDRGTVMVVDKAEVAKAQRARFGLPAPGIDAFVGPSGARVASITSPIKSAGTDAYGKWLITLADGSRWRQIDDYTLGRSPRSGQTAVVNRAAIGSFKMTVAGQATIRVRRDR